MTTMPYSAVYKERFESANRLRKQGDSTAAIKLLRKLVADFPGKPAAYLVIADIFWDNGKLASSSRAFRTATRLFPKLQIASLGLFHTLWDQSKTDAAFREMKRFQAISCCCDYEEIVNEILAKD
jgi:predicted Zn-dependent protease